MDARHPVFSAPAPKPAPVPLAARPFRALLGFLRFLGDNLAGLGHFLRHLLMHQKEIGLSEEQVGKIKTLQFELDKTRIRTEAEIEVAERELHELIRDDKADLAAIEAKLKQGAGLEVNLRLASVKARREAMALLTPEQREKEKAEHEKMMKMRGEHRKGEMDCPGCGMMKGGGPGSSKDKKEESHGH